MLRFKLMSRLNSILVIILVLLLTVFLTDRPAVASGKESEKSPIELSEILSNERGKSVEEAEIEKILATYEESIKKLIESNSSFQMELSTDLDPYLSILRYSSNGKGLYSIERISKDGKSITYREVYNSSNGVSYIYTPELKLSNNLKLGEMSTTLRLENEKMQFTYLAISKSEAESHEGRFPPGVRMMLYKSRGLVPFNYHIKDNYNESKSLYVKYIKSFKEKTGRFVLARSTGKSDDSTEIVSHNPKNKSLEIKIDLYFKGKYFGQVVQRVWRNEPEIRIPRSVEDYQNLKKSPEYSTSSKVRVL